LLLSKSCGFDFLSNTKREKEKFTKLIIELINETVNNVIPDV
jgi:hypothetical protein